MLASCFRSTINYQKQILYQAAIKVSKTCFASTWFQNIDLPKYRDGFNEIPELDSASEVVQKLFSLEYASESAIRNCVRSYNNKKYATKLEQSIVNNTYHIRMMTEKLKANPRDRAGKVFFIWAIDQRKKRLKKLMAADIESYKNIIKEHNIPPLESPHAPHNKYKFRKFKINVPLKKTRKIEDFEKDRVY
ncbi:small ribosomal subunit protein uS15m-like [Hydra vulgaris]|uniref:Small ribosomal subunit protein uS15m n=1 Tax=Hydra vulgaris TaxID=6087 RepID=A0ABM4DLT6_HYDVU